MRTASEKGDFKTLAPGNHVARGNRIARIGVTHKQGCGVAVSGVGNRVVGNTIIDCGFGAYDRQTGQIESLAFPMRPMRRRRSGRG